MADKGAKEIDRGYNQTSPSRGKNPFKLHNSSFIYFFLFLNIYSKAILFRNTSHSSTAVENDISRRVIQLSIPMAQECEKKKIYQGFTNKVFDSSPTDWQVI